MNRRIITRVIVVLVFAFSVGVILLRKHRDTAIDELAKVGEIPWALHTEDVSHGSLSSSFPVLASLSGSTEITMDMISAGESCGSCHNGKQAFASGVASCGRCHTQESD